MYEVFNMIKKLRRELQPLPCHNTLPFHSFCLLKQVQCLPMTLQLLMNLYSRRQAYEDIRVMASKSDNARGLGTAGLLLAQVKIRCDVRCRMTTWRAVELRDIQALHVHLACRRMSYLLDSSARLDC